MATKSKASILLNVFFETEPDGPKPGKGYFTNGGEKIPDSDFDVPQGVDDVEVEGQFDKETGEVWITRLNFTRDGDRTGDSVEPPKGTKPDDAEINVA